ncbi:MAG: hypothetical protein P8129_13020, partial [Anaerolineae bacterium]
MSCKTTDSTRIRRNSWWRPAARHRPPGDVLPPAGRWPAGGALDGAEERLEQELGGGNDKGQGHQERRQPGGQQVFYAL